jgi:hypothetical protein
MLSSRSTHYWLWFLLFGLIAGLATQFNSEAIALSVTGAVGLLTGFGPFTNISRGYDLIIGLIFAGLGAIGILTSFPLGHTIGISANGTIVGLSLAIPYNLIHTVLGLTSLNHSFRPAPTATKVEVAAPTQAAA